MSAGRAPVPPRWLPWWLAALPAAFVLVPAALWGLGFWRRWPPVVRGLLLFYAATQLLPAPFAEAPLAALGWGLLRTALLLGLLGVGGALAGAQALRPLGLGLVAVFLTAGVATALTGNLESRLSHPYLTPISLGVGGALGLWLALFGGGPGLWGRLAWRLPLGLLSVTALLTSGSRGALLAAGVGAIAGLLAARPRLALPALLAGAAAVAGVAALGERGGVGTLARLASFDGSGRDVVWGNALGVIAAHPWAGVGAYGVGRHLQPPGLPCTLWAQADGSAPPCPAALERVLDTVGSLWVIAHNGPLQQLAETGPLGLLGLFALIGAALAGALRVREPLLLAALAGLLAGSVLDNTVLVPSPFFAEAFWIAAGTALLALRGADLPRAGLLGAAALLALSFPLLGALRAPEPAPTGIALRALLVPPALPSGQPVTVLADLRAPPGAYRAVLQSCLDTCTYLGFVNVTVAEGQSSPLRLGGAVRGETQTLQLKLYPLNSTASLRPLATWAWPLAVRP